MLPNEIQSLTQSKRWVCYKNDYQQEHTRKIPMQAKQNLKASVTDPTTWGTYADAATTLLVKKWDYHGIGIVLGGGLCGIDLDNVILSDGSLEPEAAEIVETMNSYTEVSPSGNGLHILFYSKDSYTRKKGGKEIYSDKRYFTVTGNVYGDPKPVEERTAEASAVFSRYFDDRKEPRITAIGTTYPEDVTDAELLEKMFASAKGEEIRALYNGDLSAYGGNHSNADQALMNYLAYWTNGDAYRMDTLFRRSGLMRVKWNEVHRGDGATYGQMTIEKALANFAPYAPAPRKEVRKMQGEPLSASQTAEKPEAYTSICTYLKTAFYEDVEKVKAYAFKLTGFDNLDDATSLFPGLYVLGALPGMGKTTFAQQLADNLASRGDHVLYFSLEQTALELVTKGLSRITYEMHGDGKALQAIDIKSGEGDSETINAAIEKYSEFAKHEAIISGGLSAGKILSTIKDYIAREKVKPIVIIDYLQIIEPEEKSKSIKETIDNTVRAFKEFQTRENIIMLVISSINRADYYKPLSLTGLKETGGIEFTADVVWLLQPAAIEKIKDSTGEIQRRQIIDKAMSEKERHMLITCPKTRFGEHYKLWFTYTPAYDYFEEADEPEPEPERQKKPRIHI